MDFDEFFDSLPKKDHFRLVEIYKGKDPEWAGWHNLILCNGNEEENIAIAGPLDPETSTRIKSAINRK